MSERIPSDHPRERNFQSARALDGPLSTQLAAYSTMLRQRNQVAADAYQGLVDHLIAVDTATNAPTVGDNFPPFLLPDENGRLISSADLLATGPLIVSFNRGHWCPYCWLELGALQDCYAAIVEAGGSVVSITPEGATFSRRLKDRLGLNFPILTDLDNGFALELGLAITISSDVRAVYEKAGIDLGTFQRSNGWFLLIPATLIVDGGGIVRHAYVNADFRQRIEPESVPQILANL